ncbi:MAG: phosphoribosylformylglycinamidine synthase subunit PurL [Candidatus Neomarinimicrobiota bacterium]
MPFTDELIDFSVLTPEAIARTLSEYKIPLTVEEILRIQNDFLGRPPSLAECVLFSIEGSEHCSYKSSRNYLKKFITDGPNVVLGAKEDAGIVRVATDKAGHNYCIVMSHESHNHPSQVVPYEGAATGVGGNVRDVLCMGAEVIACTDSLRFGEIKTSKTKWIHDGVVAGIAGYGNPLGVPNIGGDLYYDEGYNDNCLVTLVTLGILREDEILHSFAPKNAAGHDIILVGKPTDNSGFGGASFASLELEEEKKEQNKGAVQEPNAFLERHLLKASYALFKILKEKGLLNKVGFKDLGAGGVSCASVEMADTAGYGADVWIDRVHISMENLHPSVYLCSETQERFMWVSPPEITALIINHYNRTFDLPGISEGAEARVIGKIRGDDNYVVHAADKEIVNAPAPMVTKGFLYDRPVKAPLRHFTEPDLPEPPNYNTVLLELLAHENIASREPVFETYDKQVQGRTVMEAGAGDAGLLQPFNSERYPEEIRRTGIALSTDHNPRYGKIDPYWCAVNAVAEAMRNVAACGATPQALTDCLCFGNPEKPEQMWEFAEATRGIIAACDTIHLKEYPGAPVPIIAGNVSFYNESRNGAIPPSPIISCLGRIDDVNKAVDQSFKQPDSLIYQVGERRDECGGSAYYALSGELGANLPRPVLEEVRQQLYALTDAIERELVLAAHDIADGGAAIALAEMCFANGIGCEVEIPGDLREDKKLFSETGGFLLEVAAENAAAVEAVFRRQGLTISAIGRTTEHQALLIGERINISISRARDAWQNGLREKLI